VKSAATYLLDGFTNQAEIRIWSRFETLGGPRRTPPRPEQENNKPIPPRHLRLGGAISGSYFTQKPEQPLFIKNQEATTADRAG
jgi:hypothetical protein